MSEAKQSGGWGDGFVDKLSAFRETLSAAQAKTPGIKWYPYDILSSLWLLSDRFTGSGRNVLKAGSSIVDVGAADGSNGFFLETLGHDVDFLDNRSTNYNDCNGIEALQKTFESRSSLHLQDIDVGHFELPRQYDLALFLGILYHLRNPMGCLLNLAQHAETMVCSTRVIRFLPDGSKVENQPVGYLLDTLESNNDPTNYWCLTPMAFRRLLKRSGWELLDEFSVGATEDSNIADKDERMFVYCRRVEGWRTLRTQHHF